MNSGKIMHIMQDEDFKDAYFVILEDRWRNMSSKVPASRRAGRAEQKRLKHSSGQLPKKSRSCFGIDEEALTPLAMRQDSLPLRGITAY